MTTLLAVLQSGGTDLAESGMSSAPYVVGGGILLVLLAFIAALLAFGRGREHS